MLARMQVLHIRNLPPDATESDIAELCKPYGRIVKTKLNTGSAKTQANQAFVEFENVNVAMKMIYSFVGSADPPKVGQQRFVQPILAQRAAATAEASKGLQEHVRGVRLFLPTASPLFMKPATFAMVHLRIQCYACTVIAGAQQDGVPAILYALRDWQRQLGLWRCWRQWRRSPPVRKRDPHHHGQHPGPHTCARSNM
jgi:hypothetical protein